MIHNVAENDIHNPPRRLRDGEHYRMQKSIAAEVNFLISSFLWVVDNPYEESGNFIGKPAFLKT